MGIHGIIDKGHIVNTTTRPQKFDYRFRVHNAKILLIFVKSQLQSHSQNEGKRSSYELFTVGLGKKLNYKFKLRMK